MKRILIALAIIAGSLAPAYGAGTIPFSLSQQFDRYGDPLSGCKLYTFKAGTTSTPQNAYQDSGLTIPQPNPIICDAAGRLPQFFLADGQVKVRLTDKSGVVQVEADGILVVGPSGGGGVGGGSVDPTAIAQTGALWNFYGSGTRSGWGRPNGRTIGSATSGATERANADCQALFQYLWAADSTLTVSGGRGASANADWVANKTIALPDFRGRAMVALADMGNTANSYYSGVTFQSGDATTLGSLVGAARRTIAQANLPNVSPTFSGSSGSLSVTSTVANIGRGSSADISTGGGDFNYNGFAYGTLSIGNITSTGSFTPSGTISALGSGSAFDTVSPFVFITTYIKL